MTLIKEELSNEKEWRKPCRLQLYIKLSSLLDQRTKEFGFTVGILIYVKCLNASRNVNKAKPTLALDTKLKNLVHGRQI